MNLQNKTILFVEDDAIFAEVHSALLRNNGYRVIHTDTGEKSIDLIRTDVIDLVLMDIDLGNGIDGAIAAREILQIKDIPIIFFTSHTEQEFMQRITDITRYGCIVKNTGHFVLFSSIEMAFKLFNAEEKYKSLLVEKEILLREVHHRIKNNMASVSSLLSLQADYIDEPKVVAILEEVQNRILGMMLIYDKLYKSTDYKNISIKEYLNDLVDQIRLFFPNNNRVNIEREMEDFKLNSKSLFSIGIIVNELITNAFKYAFPDNRTGKLTVRTRKLEEDKVELIVQDDGIGLPKTFSLEKSKGFGLNLIKMLTNKKGNSFDIYSKEGASFKIIINI